MARITSRLGFLSEGAITERGGWGVRTEALTEVPQRGGGSANHLGRLWFIERIHEEGFLPDIHVYGNHHRLAACLAISTKNKQGLSRANKTVS